MKLLLRRSSVALPQLGYFVVWGRRVTAAVAWFAVRKAFALLSLQMVGERSGEMLGRLCCATVVSWP